MYELDLREPRRIHVVGVGGSGMSALALLLREMGHTVSGSDLHESRALERLRLAGVDVTVGHAADNVAPSTDAVVISSAVPWSNLEVRSAQERGVPVLRRADALRALVATRRTIAVAGSHGKTTTSSMLALVLLAAGREPSFLIGGELHEVGTNAARGAGDLLVVEADESDGTFLEIEPAMAVVTNVEPDHLEHYGTFDDLVAAFDRFLARIPELAVVCADDPVARRLVEGRAGTVTYGESDDADYRLTGYESGGRVGSRFDVWHRDERLGAVELAVPGRHNAINALGALATASELGVDLATIIDALRNFGGVARRFHFKGEIDGVTLVDDYAHLPAELRATIRAARECGWRRVVAVFQPYRYIRTSLMWRDFADAFTDADLLVLTDVCAPAAEVPIPGVSGRLILRAVLDAHPSLPVAYFPRRAELAADVLQVVRPGDVVLTMGVGDVGNLAEEMLAIARARDASRVSAS
ncbi:MAG TPA: UDP-N-acetylmuramate--L-alanine ligase [Acidimicrobiia bacterium]|nr:UDP-N-acetylmuramate--L-alanine ligase [Acidimicrobiia bacterium]